MNHYYRIILCCSRNIVSPEIQCAWTLEGRVCTAPKYKHWVYSTHTFIHSTPSNGAQSTPATDKPKSDGQTCLLHTRHGLLGAWLRVASSASRALRRISLVLPLGFPDISSIWDEQGRIHIGLDKHESKNGTIICGASDCCYSHRSLCIELWCLALIIGF